MICFSSKLKAMEICFHHNSTCKEIFSKQVNDLESSKTYLVSFRTKDISKAWYFQINAIETSHSLVASYYGFLIDGLYTVQRRHVSAKCIQS